LICQSADSANLRAATNTVTSTADSGAGTLRGVLANAHDGDTINFSLPPPATITLTSGELRLTNSVTIAGPGATNLAVDGNANSRVFHIAQSNTVTLTGLTITNGNFNGAGVYNDRAKLTISNCTVIGNSTANFTGLGGGFYSYYGTADIINCTFSGNSAIYGAAIYNDHSTVNIQNSTIAANMAQGGGGGILNDGISGPGALTVANTTISGNSGRFFGGGIAADARFGGSGIKVINCTFNNNAGGNIFYESSFGDVDNPGLMQIGSTILDNGGASGPDIFIFDANSKITFVSLGYNLSSDDGAGVLSNATDHINTDPKLGPLQDNGGPTFTHAFTCRSLAIDNGRNFSDAATDQRGFAFPRIFDDPAATNTAGGDGTDIGAFEAQQSIAICDLPPVADASATVPLIISPNGTNASVILDGSLSTDPDGDLLTYGWYETGDPLASGVVAVTVLPVGSHSIQLVVNDGTLSATNGVTIEVVTAAEAVDRLVATLCSDVPHPQPLLAALNAALASMDRSNPVSAANQLQAFQNKVRAQVEPFDSVLAASLIQSAQDIIDSLGSGGGHAHGHFTSLTRGANDRARVQFTAGTAATYIVEASTDLVNWEKIGIAVKSVEGQYSFEDLNSAKFPRRYYRVVLP
jgi:hypothetical protein